MIPAVHRGMTPFSRSEFTELADTPGGVVFAVVRSGVAAWGSKFDQVTTWRTIGPPLVRAEINAGLYPLRVTRMLYEQGVLLKDSDFAAKDLDARVAFNGKMTEMDAKAVVSGVARLDQKEITEWVSLVMPWPKMSSNRRNPGWTRMPTVPDFSSRGSAFGN